MQEEIWKDLTGYEGIYQVSNKGQVKSIPRPRADNRYTMKEVILKPADCRGYKKVNVTKDGLKKCVSVHRLIAMTFIPNPENKPCVNHKNGIKSDNRVENLEWCTLKENSQHALKAGFMAMGSSRKNSKLKEEDVILIRNTPRTRVATKALVEKYNMNRATINRIRNGQGWQHVKI